MEMHDYVRWMAPGKFVLIFIGSLSILHFHTFDIDKPLLHDDSAITTARN
jgi:hypothetical protein